MLNKEYIEIKENIRIISILFLISLCNLNNLNYYIVITWIINIIILGNVRRIKSTNNFCLLIRFSGYFIHLLIFYVLFLLIYFPIQDQIINYLYLKIILSVIFLFLFLYYKNNFKKFKFIYNDIEYNKLKLRNNIYFFRLYSSIFSPVAEELYFRFFFIKFLNSYGILSILISSIYFCIFHYFSDGGKKFSLRDYLLQFIFSLLVGGTYYYSGNIIYAILFHYVYNIPFIILNYKFLKISIINLDKKNINILDDFEF